MIKVIRQAHRCEFARFTCKNCHSVLEADISSVEHEISYPDVNDYITCPVCAHHIPVHLSYWSWEAPKDEENPYNPYAWD